MARYGTNWHVEDPAHRAEPDHALDREQSNHGRSVTQVRRRTAGSPDFPVGLSFAVGPIQCAPRPSNRGRWGRLDCESCYTDAEGESLRVHRTIELLKPLTVGT